LAPATFGAATCDAGSSFLRLRQKEGARIWGVRRLGQTLNLEQDRSWCSVAFKGRDFSRAVNALNQLSCPENRQLAQEGERLLKSRYSV
jgi:hypothetical protein